jgi:hypothetical protein
MKRRNEGIIIMSIYMYIWPVGCGHLRTVRGVQYVRNAMQQTLAGIWRISI